MEENEVPKCDVFLPVALFTVLLESMLRMHGIGVHASAPSV